MRDVLCSRIHSVKPASGFSQSGPYQIRTWLVLVGNGDGPNLPGLPGIPPWAERCGVSGRVNSYRAYAIDRQHLMRIFVRSVGRLSEREPPVVGLEMEHAGFRSHRYGRNGDGLNREPYAGDRAHSCVAGALDSPGRAAIAGRDPYCAAHRARIDATLDAHAVRNGWRFGRIDGGNAADPDRRNANPIGRDGVAVVRTHKLRAKGGGRREHARAQASPEIREMV